MSPYLHTFTYIFMHKFCTGATSSMYIIQYDFIHRENFSFTLKTDHKFTPSSINFGEGNGTPLQYSCLKNPMGGGAWKPAVRGVAESRTRLSDLAVAAALTCTSTEDVCPSPKIYFLNNLGLVLILTSEFLGLEPSSPRIIP